jgi:catechol 2,3-dioxygenase-like lactoylglutathione lyase family enzyme
MGTMAQTQVETKSSGIPQGLSLQAVDHLALVTDDMAETVRFYTEMLGMTLVHAMRTPEGHDAATGNPPYGNIRHYFFDMGNDGLVAFFEYPKGLAMSDRDAPGGMQHVAFHGDRATFQRFQDHFKEKGLPFVGPLDLGVRWSIYFFDNNGIRLEITTVMGTEDFEAVSSVLQTEEAARAELSTLFGSEEELKSVLGSMKLAD